MIARTNTGKSQPEIRERAAAAEKSEKSSQTRAGQSSTVGQPQQQIMERQQQLIGGGIIASIVVFLVMCFFNGLASAEIGQEWGIYTQSTGNVSDKHDTDLTPAGWTFSIWGIIYCWQAIWLIYALSTFCRQGVNGALYYSPGLLPFGLFATYIANNILNASWLIIWDRENMIAALVVIVFITLLLYICLILSYRELDAKLGVLEAYNLSKEAWWIRGTVHNGLSIYAAWTTCATFINMTIVMQYDAGVGKETAGTISFSLLTALFVLYAVLDVTLLDRYTRFTFTPYFTLWMALSGILYKKWADPVPRNAVFAVVLPALVAALFAIKLSAVVYRQCKGNMQSDSTQNDTQYGSTGHEKAK